MDVILLYTTNTLHLIVSHLEPLQQLALRCLNKKIYNLPLSYLSLTIRVLLSPGDFSSSKQYLPELITVFSLCLQHAFKQRAQELLTLLRYWLPVHVIRDDTNGQIFRSLYRIASDAVVPRRSIILDLTEEVAQRLYMKVIVRDPSIYAHTRIPLPAKPQESRVLFVIDRQKVLPFFDTCLIGSKLRSNRTTLKLLSPGIYSVGSYVKANNVISSAKERLGEVLLWYLWITRYYADHDYHATCVIHGRFITQHDFDTIGVEGLIREVGMSSR